MLETVEIAFITVVGHFLLGNIVNVTHSDKIQQQQSWLERAYEHKREL
jgi:hypothetical protein